MNSQISSRPQIIIVWKIKILSCGKVSNHQSKELNQFRKLAKLSKMRQFYCWLKNFEAYAYIFRFCLFEYFFIVNRKIKNSNKKRWKKSSVTD